ncbi:MAG: DUF1351 domain-containing protein [Treponemataceae bacterium]|nr:DUF1351 domain-containing protein [Treponemataceae bacterium]
MENSLSLIVKEKTLGSLITNAQDIKKFVAEKLETYSVDNYVGDEKQAAKDKAELNAAAKQLNDERIKLEREWLEPFNEFKDVVNETTGMIKAASAKLDAIVKAKEERGKAEKKEVIADLWRTKHFELVSLDRIFNPKWLNKTYKLETINSDMDAVVSRINGDLASLDAFGADTAQLKELYLSTLDLQATLNKGAELKANRERLEAAKKQEAEKQTEAVSAEQPPVEAEENECAAAPKTGPAKTDGKIYTFHVYGDLKEVVNVGEIAEEMNLEIVPSITMKGDAMQITKFKQMLAEKGIGYSKQGLVNLLVSRMECEE